MKAQELAAYTLLNQIFGDDIRVLPKVSLSELIVKFRPPKEQVPHWSRVQLRRIDFLVCEGPQMEPILAIILVTTSSSERRKSQGRDVIEDVLEDIGLPLLKLRARGEYDRDELTRRVNLSIQEHQSTIATHREEDSVMDTPSSSAGMDESSNSVLSSTLRFLTGIRARYRNNVARTPTDPPH